jgi:GAF domain-containing protein
MVSPPLLSPDPGAETFRDRTLARLVEHVLALIPVGPVTFVAVGDEPGIVDESADWLDDDVMRRVVAAALDRPLLLPAAGASDDAPDLLPRSAASVIACPVRTELGRPLGVLVAASLDPARPLRSADLRTLEVVADLAAMALERARLLDTADGRARDELLLKRAADAVSQSLELDEVYRRVVEHAAEVTGATKALLTRLNARAGTQRTVASVDLASDPARDPLTLDGDGFGHVARTRQPVLHVGDPDVEFGGGLMEREDVGSLMHAPIELGPRLYGVLSVAHENPGHFGEEDLDLLARLARSSAAAIANAIDFARERRIARTLTLGFVPESLPEVAGYDTGLLYAPALGEPTGGDLYGAWQLPCGEVAVLVGDVAGKGVQTAALSAMARFFIEARSWDARSPAQVLEQANSMLLTRLPRDTFVTAFLGVLSPGALRWAAAGHLPALQISAAGARTLDAHGLPLGIDPAPGYRDSELEMSHGDLVFAYTDGLIEARRGARTYGIDRLIGLVARHAAALDPEDLVRTVHEEISGWAGGLADDAVALALRRRH